MKVGLMVVLGLALAAAWPASAERIAIESATQRSEVSRPGRGMTMIAVEAKFGSPRERLAAVGDPPITRWNYEQFSVFFEHDRVIHAVAKR